MHRTVAHISVATKDEPGLPSLFELVEAHEETWEASTTDPQTYATVIEHQATGAGRRWIAGREYAAAAGTLSVFAAGTLVQAEEILPGKPSRVTYLTLAGPMAEAVERALEVRPDRPLILPAASPGLAIGLSECARIVFRRRHNWPWSLVESLANLTRAIAEARDGKPTTEDRLADRVRRIVEESPHHPWSVKELAVLLDMRREALWEGFKEQTGQSPGEWIRRHRIRVTEGMLARGVSVRQAAERLGFSSRQQLARTFRTVTGHAPSRR